MARLLLPSLCGVFALLLLPPWAASDTVRCSRPKDVANAFIEAGDDALLNTRLRYTCKPGYKRKAGTSSLIQCILSGTKPVWTEAQLECIRDPALPPEIPGPELPTASCTPRTTQRQTTGASPTSSLTPAATPVPPVTDGPSPETSAPPEMPPTGKGTALGTTRPPSAPGDHAAVSTQILASSIALPMMLVVAGVVGCCCWRMKMHARQDYAVAPTAIPMVAPAAAAENEEALALDVTPVG